VNTKQQPLYSIICEELEKAIRSGELRPGNALPSQNELARMYDVSTMTTRRALGELERSGLITRIQGKGSFVNHLSQGSEGFSRIGFVHHLTNETNNEGLFNPFYVNAIRGVIKGAEKHGLPVSYQIVSDTYDRIKIWDDTAWILLDASRDVVAKLKESNKPMVSIHSYYPDLDIPFVVSDDVAGGYEVTSHLLSLGHRRIGIFLPESLMNLPQEFSNRYQGYVSALKQHKVELDARLIAEKVKISVYDGYVAAIEMLESSDPPTAIFALTDMQALGVLRAAEDLGIRVPDELSIAGYDDQVYSGIAEPALTTVRQDVLAIGERAVDILVSEVEAKERQHLMVNLRPELVVRESTAKVYTQEKEVNQVCVVGRSL
jgi:LacI family repressor for deo operon, udp, cdd, tsx, nupC, and nupG